MPFAFLFCSIVASDQMFGTKIYDFRIWSFALIFCFVEFDRHICSVKSCPSMSVLTPKKLKCESYEAGGLIVPASVLDSGQVGNEIEADEFAMVDYGSLVRMGVVVDASWLL